MSSKNLAGYIVIAILIITGCAGSSKWTNVDVSSTDPNIIVAAGIAQSPDLQLAIDKATLSARTEIARQLETRLNNLQKQFAEEIGAGNNTELNLLYSSATKAVVSTQLMGSKVKDTKHREKNGKYEASVTVEYLLGEENVVLVEQIKKDENLYKRFRASEGFKELEAEVEKYQKLKNNQ